MSRVVRDTGNGRHAAQPSSEKSLTANSSNAGLPLIGFGEKGCDIAVCIANRPVIDDYPQLDQLKPLAKGELQHIVANTSNHWRKVFNVFAKLLYQLADERMNPFPSWQSYRDQQLLQLGSREALLFSPPNVTSVNALPNDNQTIYIIAGKTYAAELKVPGLIWLDTYFAIHRVEPIIVSPYLDYRQLSNQRIEQLVQLVHQVRARRVL